MTQASKRNDLKRELLALSEYLQTMKQELAAIRNPNAERDHFETMSDQLEAVVGATESATETILGSVEEIGGIAAELRERIQDDAAAGLLARLDDKIGVIFEACTFQDITGQRISKIARSMAYVDQRVRAIAEIWGAASLAEVAVPEPETDPQQALLDGPALAGEGTSQDDIDKMFD